MANNVLLSKEKNVKIQYLHFAVATLLMLLVAKYPVSESFLTAGDVVLDSPGRVSWE